MSLEGGLLPFISQEKSITVGGWAFLAEEKESKRERDLSAWVNELGPLYYARLYSDYRCTLGPPGPARPKPEKGRIV
jgi:hypothetical protein